MLLSPGLRFVAGAAVVLALLSASPPAQAQEHPRVLACHRILEVAPHSKERIARFIRCAGETWDAPGKPGYWVSIARCESGLYWRSSNGGDYVGVWQHALSAWPSRTDKYLDPLDIHNKHWWSPEASTIVAMRMAHASGWGPWSCA